MAKNQISITDENFELMDDTPREDPVIAERRRAHENEITKKLGEYLLKGYCMLGDACEDCNCILLRTPEKKLFCINCEEIEVAKKQEETNEQPTKKANKKKNRSKKVDTQVNHCVQLENKLKWAVDELSKSQSPIRINEMCSVIVKLTETIKALKQYQHN